jgi:hypothetical protein
MGMAPRRRFEYAQSSIWTLVADFNEETSPCPCNVVKQYSNTDTYIQIYSTRKTRETPTWSRQQANILATFLMIVSSSAYSILKTEATNYSGTSTDFRWDNRRYEYISECIFFTSSCPHLGACCHFWSIGLISKFLDHSQAVELLGRVISSSQGLYLNTGQQKHRKTRTNVKHPCPEWVSKPWSRLPIERKQYMP